MPHRTVLWQCAVAIVTALYCLFRSSVAMSGDSGRRRRGRLFCGLTQIAHDQLTSYKVVREGNRRPVVGGKGRQR